MKGAVAAARMRAGGTEAVVAARTRAKVGVWGGTDRVGEDDAPCAEPAVGRERHVAQRPRAVSPVVCARWQSTVAGVWEATRVSVERGVEGRA